MTICWRVNSWAVLATALSIGFALHAAAGEPRLFSWNVAGGDTHVYEVNPDTGEYTEAHQLPRRGDGRVEARPGTNLLLVFTQNRTGHRRVIHEFDVDTWERREIPLPLNQLGYGDLARTTEIDAVAIDPHRPDELIMAVTGFRQGGQGERPLVPIDSRFASVDLQTGELTRDPVVTAHRYEALTFLPDGSLIGALHFFGHGDRSPNLHTINPFTGEDRLLLKLHRPQLRIITGLTVGPRGQLWAINAFHSDQLIRISLATGEVETVGKTGVQGPSGLTWFVGGPVFALAP